MTGAGTTEGARERWSPLAVVPAAALGVLVAVLLAGGETESVDSAVRAVADLAAATTLGLGVVLLAGATSRHVDDARAWRAVAVTAGTWCVAEAALLLLGAARSQGLAASDLTTAGFADYLGGVVGGRLGAAVVLITALLASAAVVVVRTGADVTGVLVVVPVGVAVVMRPITGHLGQQAFGAPTIALHVLAASIWLGVLLALALTLRTRGGWAEMLPRYSRAAGWCVGIVVITGVVAAVGRVGSVSALIDDGYGRLVLTKAALAVLLVAGGWWRRRTWVATIGDHRTSAPVSVGRAVSECALMAVAFGVASTLATTG
ncbi:CopD family protein [Rhodococcoides corynebacterioides]|uniref:CopD family protein n=1 Tax=Rhodococcoides corynebacterioides TaxID=53972 RepID=UPI001C9B84E8|nr:CopD family protein [Rhodococcus corynebacterioides]MBY6364459.1 CopD family protein [Rhodococcus corynebacterioides]